MHAPLSYPLAPLVEEIVPGLFLWRSSQTGPHQPVNSYILACAQGLTLVDPAGDLTPRALQQLRLGSVTDIFVTHVQEEHITGCRHFPEARIHIPEGDEYLCQGWDAYRACITTWPPPWEWEGRGNFKGHLGGACNERPGEQPLPVLQTLRPGEEIEGISVLSTPGHGKNAVTLLKTVAGERVVFCGDLVYGGGQLWNWFDCEWDYGQETGQRSLRDSANKLRQQMATMLCPAHGPVIREPVRALATLCERIEATLSEPVVCEPINFPEKDSPVEGWRELLPGLHQWRSGNCAVLISQTGNALMVDDGLCYWSDLPERRAHHGVIIDELKRSLGVSRIDMIIATHYHGDHLENIPDLVALEDTEVVALDVVAEVMEHPAEFNLACMLPWYGTARDIVPVDCKVPDQTRLYWHEYELEIFHLAGQTYRHAGIATTVDGKRVLFVGDALPGWHSPPEPVMCYNDNEPEHRGWAYAVDRMLERRPDLLVCGHGAAIRDPMPLLEEKQIAWRQRIEQFKELSARDELRLFFDPFV